MSELFLVAKLQYSSSLKYVEWLIIVSIWYLIQTTIASIAQAWVEVRFGGAEGRRGSTWRGLPSLLGVGKNLAH